MDEITDHVGALNLTAKEWKPGLGFAPTPKKSAVSAEGISSSQAVDVNGTHFFGSGGGASSSWEQDGGGGSGQHHLSAAQSAAEKNIPHHTNTTIPSLHHNNNQRSNRDQQRPQQHRATTLSSALSLPMDEYHHYRELSLTISREMAPNDPRHKAVPPTFCRAYPLDNHGEMNESNNTMTQQRSSFGYPTSLFRVTSVKDGNLYCLRRLDSVRSVSHKIIQTCMQKWNIPGMPGEQFNGGADAGGFDHPNVVKWYKCFLSQRAVFFVHHYHAGAVTFRERFFSQEQQGGGQGGVPLPEPFIWSCLVQLVSAIRAVHGNKLAVRTLQLNHILCTQENIASASSSSGQYGLPKLRLRVNCVGIIDTLEFETRRELEDLQQQDMRALGCLLLSMCTGREVTINDVFPSRNITMQEQQQRGQMLMDYFQFVQQNYSREMYMLMHSVLNPQAPPSNIHGVATNMAMRVFDELDEANSCIDEMHGALNGIYESGRALRLLLKLAFVNERPEMGFDKNWSESGDCYILKLFRDFGELVFFIIRYALPQ